MEALSRFWITKTTPLFYNLEALLAQLVNANWHSYKAQTLDLCGFESRAGHHGRSAKMASVAGGCNPLT